MDPRRDERLRVKLEILRQKRGIRPSELESFAKKLGRRRAKRGREPTWVSDLLPSARPISIPNHPGDLNRFTAASILDRFEQDLELLADMDEAVPSSEEDL